MGSSNGNRELSLTVALKFSLSHSNLIMSIADRELRAEISRLKVSLASLQLMGIAGA